MKFVPIWSYDNYVPAHLAMGRLKEDGIEAWLKDENSVTINPILTNAVGGIKLMVAESKAERALALLQQLEKDYKASLSCPKCGSHNIELINTPRKASNWIDAIFEYSFGSFARGVEQVYHCFNCKYEFEEPVSNDN